MKPMEECMFYLVRASVGIEAKDVYFEDALETVSYTHLDVYKRQHRR